VTLSLTFYGVRGSTPVPGSATTRYGGNTPCLLVESERGRIVLDAGTGIRSLGRKLMAGEAEPLALDVLLTHTHWDHIQGLPFFQPLYRAGNRITIHGPPPRGRSLESVLGAQMEPSVFPVPLAALAAEPTVAEITTPEIEVSGFEVTVIPARHPAPTLGFSIARPGSSGSIIYLTDNELCDSFPAWERRRLVRFLHQADTLVHDAMYFESERRARLGWGHSSAGQAVRLALEAGCRRLVLFHHDPDHDDRALERLLDEARAARDGEGGSLDLLVATEGSTLHCEEAGT